MAIIQDLPPELLRNILELVDARFHVASRVALCHAALVARAWRQPSQELLLSLVEVEDLQKLPAFTLQEKPLTLRRVCLNYYDIDKYLPLLQDRGAVISTLMLRGDAVSGIDVSAISLELLRSVKTLGLWGHATGLVIPQGIELAARGLALVSDQPPPPAILDSVLGAAPFLTSLALAINGSEDFPAESNAPLSIVAPRLRRLSINRLGPPTPGYQPSPNFLRFISSCTSLRKFEIEPTTSDNLKIIVRRLTAHLTVLTTEVTWSRGKEHRRVAELATVLALPALANLKRWRYSGDDQWPDVDSGSRWEEMCRARGVEPRDEGCFFTDYPAS